MLGRLLREPLLHFLAAGAAIFGLHLMVAPDRGQRHPTHIVVDSNQIKQLAALWQRTRQRAPTAEELRGLVDEYVKEEIYYREALALGLDRDDTIIRRRMRQKMEFLTLADADNREPLDEELRNYMARHADKYRSEPKASFRQVFLSPTKRGAAADQDAQQILTGLRAQGRDANVLEIGDPTQLPLYMALSSKGEIAKVFGGGFAEQIVKFEIGQWSGPIRSSYGLHLVLVEQNTPSAEPNFDELRTIVVRDWQAAWRKAAEQNRFKVLSKAYSISIEWPQTAQFEGGADR
ncbi:MAG: peptidyl-prolyl cis-trans isomerase [Hyphomicrobiaceae bacterium]